MLAGADHECAVRGGGAVSAEHVTGRISAAQAWTLGRELADFDPRIETADYRWNLSALLTWLDTGAQREYRESQSHHCAADDPSSQSYSCREIFDDTGGLIGTRFGRLRLDLAINLGFVLRAVPEPSPLALMLFAVVPVALRARRS